MRPASRRRAQTGFEWSYDRVHKILAIAALMLFGTAALAQQGGNQISNADIAKMLKAGVELNTVKWVIDNSTGKLDATPAALQKLKAAGASQVSDERLSQITPVVELVGIFHPAIPDVSAVVHIGNQNILDAGVDLGLRLLHGGAEADDDQDNA